MRKEKNCPTGVIGIIPVQACIIKPEPKNIAEEINYETFYGC